MKNSHNSKFEQGYNASPWLHHTGQCGHWVGDSGCPIACKVEAPTIATFDLRFHLHVLNILVKNWTESPFPKAVEIFIKIWTLHKFSMNCWSWESMWHKINICKFLRLSILLLCTHAEVLINGKIGVSTLCVNLQYNLYNLNVKQFETAWLKKYVQGLIVICTLS